MYTKLERELYNESREAVCKGLNITKNQYNWLRRKGELLHKVYEDNCNGLIDENTYDSTTGMLCAHVDGYVGDLGLFVYYQTDPRGATIYVDKKPIPENNYTTAYCVF